MPHEIVFYKSGLEVKTAILKRKEQLEQRLASRNMALDAFMTDQKKVRSFLVRSTAGGRFHDGGEGYTLYSKDEISSEESQEIRQLCRRIFEIEQELHRLTLIATHLRDDQQLELRFDDLIGYGFDTSIETE
jgi:hypothetical protein